MGAELGKLAHHRSAILLAHLHRGLGAIVTGVQLMHHLHDRDASVLVSL